MPDRYDALSDSAKQLMANFDEIDLADMLADAMDAGVKLRQKLAEARAKAFHEAADLLEADIDELRAEQRFKDGHGDTRGPGLVQAVERLRGLANPLEETGHEPAPAVCRCGADPVHQMGCDAE